MRRTSSKTKRSSSSVKGRTSSRSITTTHLPLLVVEQLARGLRRSGVNGRRQFLRFGHAPAGLTERLCPPTMNPLPRVLCTLEP